MTTTSTLHIVIAGDQEKLAEIVEDVLDNIESMCSCQFGEDTCDIGWITSHFESGDDPES